ncbi:hypothetical protein [Rothia koreensis]
MKLFKYNDTPIRTLVNSGGDPQVRVTAKGLYKLRDLMLYPLELTA